MAWQCILLEMTVEGLRSSAVDETGDDALCDETEEDGNVRG